MTELPLFERLQIESISRCNRSCWFCPRTYDTSGKYLDASGEPVRNAMPTSTILDLLDQAQGLGFIGRVGFHHYSEPLLDPRNVELALEAKERGMQPCLVTNGDVLRDRPQKCSEVMKAYDHIVIGLYDYESQSELEAAKAYWRSMLPVTALEFSTIGLSNAAKSSIAAPRVAVPGDIRFRAPNFAFPNAPCHRPLVRMLVQHDGEVALCCEDISGEHHLGNVNQMSLREIWQSEAHIRIVNDLVAGKRDKYSLCCGCPATPTAGLSDGRQISIVPR
ncbi:MAG: radical SAM protein [Pseudomonadales bacterium]|nr:radical SAM protein [Pseudomonadales bacterium]NIX09058.1 radical SAM protein [Pseudomonadales bacterium]